MHRTVGNGEMDQKRINKRGGNMPLECQNMNIIYEIAISGECSHSPNTWTDPQMAAMKKAKSERLATPSNMPLALRVDASSHARTLKTFTYDVCQIFGILAPFPPSCQYQILSLPFL